MKNVIISLILSIILCVNLRISAQPCFSYKAKKKRFKIVKREGIVIDTNKIKLNGVYLWKLNNVNSVKDTFYLFIRFFNNCRVFKSGPYCSCPTVLQLNDLTYGSYGQYMIKEDKLIIESYSGPGGYYYQYFDVFSKHIIPIGTKKRAKFPQPEFRKELINKEYWFYPFNFDTYYANW